MTNILLVSHTLSLFHKLQMRKWKKHELRVKSYELKSASYEFKSTS